MPPDVAQEVIEELIKYWETQQGDRVDTATLDNLVLQLRRREADQHIRELQTMLCAIRRARGPPRPNPWEDLG